MRAPVNVEDEAWFQAVIDHDAPPQIPAKAAASSWRRVDLGPILAADRRPVLPTIGARDDGRGVLYPGRSHTVSGESEGLKSWFAQFVALRELGLGRSVIYLDFEDDADSVTNRMVMLGAVPDWLHDRFAYISPSEPITSTTGRHDLAEAVGDLSPSLVVLDGVTEALSLHGLSTNDNDELARFGRLITRPLTDAGTAVLALDHLTKSVEGRGRYALGGVPKLNAVSGAAFILENVNRFGQGLIGRSRLLIAKDRPGKLREHALAGSADRYWYADLVIDAARTPEPAELETPHISNGPFRPTVLMVKVSDALAGAPTPLNSRGVLDRVTGKAEHVRQALAALVDEGFIEVTSGPRGAQLHQLIKPFPGDEQ